jgi:tetratricopeptide (TPR) repeat protein
LLLYRFSLHFQLNDFAMAEAYLQEAIELAKQMPELVDSGIFQVNLGLLYLQQGLLARAKDVCSLAWKVGSKMKSQETIHQANYCLDQIKLMTK